MVSDRFSPPADLRAQAEDCLPRAKEGAIAEIAVNVPLRRLFHYLVPSSLEHRLEVGHRVQVPFGGRTTTGICVGFPARSEVERLKPIRSLMHPDYRFDSHLLALTKWIADYYRVAWGEVLEAALPPAVRSGRDEPLVSWISAARPCEEMLQEAARIEKRARNRARLLRYLAQNPEAHPRSELLKKAEGRGDALRWLLENGWAASTLDRARQAAETEDLGGLSSRSTTALHPDQESALATVRSAVEDGAFRTLLIHGVTGSGKTEVYLRALREVLSRGKRGLILVPEISLTPQIVLRFQEGLPGETVAVLHSMLGASQRAREWKEVQEGKASVVIGARSAVFAPIRDLGLIVVDEEHDSSYKQESSPRYNARDVAVLRARMLGIPIVLGSATPSLESIHNARSGKYSLVEMPRRVTSHDLPIVTITPLDGDFYRLDGSGLVTDQLDMLIRRRLRAEEQVLLFLNRRGFATYLHCMRCGYVLKCPECDITLTFHRHQAVARCHYCGHNCGLPSECPDCDLPGLRRSGAGTEKISAELERRYDGARVARLDRDTASTHRAMRSTIARFARGEFDILVGTQMIAKGHDFPKVTLVGIINADTSLHFPDFRASERTFQLITQVAGRAGRGSRAGRVVIQTFFPDHYAIRCAAQGDYGEFCRRELELRRSLGYPPYGRLVKILLQGPDAETLEQEAARIREALSERSGFRILGPVPSPIARIQGKHRRQMLLKSSSPAALRGALEHLERTVKKPGKGMERVIDVDPLSML